MTDRCNNCNHLDVAHNQQGCTRCPCQEYKPPIANIATIDLIGRRKRPLGTIKGSIGNIDYVFLVG